MGLSIDIYNYLATIFWAVGLIFSIITLIVPEYAQYLNPYYIFIQTFMFLDIVHAILKLSSGNVFATCLQVASRIYVVWAIVRYQPGPNIWNYCMYAAWSIAEIIRYQYYIHKSNHGILLFLRYNAFIILYPIGIFAGEMPLIYQNYKITRNRIHFYILFLYVPFFPYLYLHMLKLRKKKTAQKKIQ